MIRGCELILFKQCQLDSLECDFCWHLMIVDDAKIRSINKEARNIDEVTDVLSFPMVPFETGPGSSIYQNHNKPVSLRNLEDWRNRDLMIVPESMLIELGDVVLSKDQCIKQAGTIGHSIASEFWRLACHGLLHLFGYDHVNSIEDRDRMEKREDVLFNRVAQA